jgi:diguanylate cyclase (GGDEF)-like protein
VRRAALALALLAGVAAAADAPLLGAPPVATFKPDLDFYPQQFAIAQDAAGRVYFGGGDGTLLFDGARWTLLGGGAPGSVRTLAWDGGARVYVGGFGRFGWFAEDATGAVRYHDLTDKALAAMGGERFADIWEMFVVPEGVLFRALYDAFLYDPAHDALRHWHHDGRFGTAYRDADGLVLQWRGEGFKRLVDDRWLPVPGGDAPGFEDLVYAMLPLPDGGWLALARSGGWLALRDGRVGPAALPRGMPDPARVQDGIVLADGSLALLGDDGVIFIWDPRRAVVDRVRITDERLSAAVVARDGGLLISAYSQVHRLQWPTSWTALGPDAGVRGSVHGAASWRGRRVLLTGSGASIVGRRPDGELGATRLDWTDHEAWALLELDPERALFADSYALYLIEGGRRSKLSDDVLYPRHLARSRFDPDLVFVGTELGLALARRTAAGWRIVARHEDKETPRFLRVVQTDPDTLWIASERAGLLRATLDGDRIARLDPVSEAQGLELGGEPLVDVARLPDGRLVASTARGLFRLDGERFVPEPLDGLDALRAPDSVLSLVVGPDGSTWAWDRFALHHRPLHGAWQREDVGTIRRGVLEQVMFDGDGTALVTTTLGVLLNHPQPASAQARAPQVALRAATVLRAGQEPRALELGPRKLRYQVAQDEEAIRFQLALPELRRVGEARFRTRLEGYEAGFGAWDAAAQQSYSRLPPGEYRFLAEARDANGAVTAIEPFEFEVVPRWYASAAARALWALLAVVLLYAATRALVRRRTERLAADKQRLETMVEARTRELADANRKLDTMAHLDGLTGIPNRRKLDEYLAQVWEQNAVRERPLAVLAIDVDRFKEYNDRHGHLAGDNLLKRLAPILARNLRRTEDLAARYGGEEFLVVLPGADALVAREVAETLRQKVASSSLGTTISIGVASETPRSGRAVTELVAAADAALYRAKERGRDRVVVQGG